MRLIVGDLVLKLGVPGVRGVEGVRGVVGDEGREAILGWSDGTVLKTRVKQHRSATSWS